LLSDGCTVLVLSGRTHKEFQGTGTFRRLAARLMADFTGDVMVFSGEISASTRDVRSASNTLYTWVGSCALLTVAITYWLM